MKDKKICTPISPYDNDKQLHVLMLLQLVMVSVKLLAFKADFRYTVDSRYLEVEGTL